METTNINDIQDELNQSNEQLNDDMGFLGGNTESSKYSKFYFAKLYTKKGTQPHFTFSRNVDGKFVQVKGTTQTISGTLKKISFGSYEYEGNQLKTVRFLLETLNENGELVAINWSCGWNMVMINLVNCLLNTNDEVKSLLISVYTDKNTGYNKSMFRINGKKPEWKYSNDQLNEKKEKIYNKKGELVKTEMGDLIEFLEYELQTSLPILLPHFRPEDEPSGHQVKFVEESMSTVLDVHEDKESDLMDEMFNDIPTTQPSEQKLKNKKQGK